MTQKGYFLVGIRKTVTLYLWNKSREYLEQVLAESNNKKNRRVVPCFVDGNKHYIEVGDELIRIQ